MRLVVQLIRGSHYGWVLTATLALTVTVSYGVLLYAFPIMLVPMQGEPGWSRTLLTGGFSAATLAAGVAAIPVGRWIDRYGVRVVMTAGSTLAVALLLAWSQVHDPVSYLLVWIGLGGCMAAVFYEPAFAAVTQWSHEHRARSLTVITVAGGLASTLFVPLASALVDAVGWRSAVVWLAITLGVATIPPHALLLRSRPNAMSSRADSSRALAPGSVRAAGVTAHRALRSRAFTWIAVAFFLATMVNLAVAVHLVPMLLERGFTLTVAASALALLGLAKLPGRMLFAPIAARWSARTAIVWMLALQVVALLVFNTMHGAAGLWLFIALFGAGDGASTPARAELLAQLFGAREYGRITGALAFVLSLGRAAGPIGASLAWTALGTYDAVLWLLVSITGVAVLAMTRVRRVPRPRVCHAHEIEARAALRPSATSSVYLPDNTTAS